MSKANEPRGGVLILPGGRPQSAAASRAWQFANQRMMWLAWSMRRNLRSGIEIRRVQYRKRGWNSPTLDALRDAETRSSGCDANCAAKRLC